MLCDAVGRGLRGAQSKPPTGIRLQYNSVLEEGYSGGQGYYLAYPTNILRVSSVRQGYPNVRIFLTDHDL
jgi:hypothetical protein